jgi:hypothetical protein
MKKSSLFISGMLTTFILTVMAGTISAFRAYSASAAQQPLTAVQQVTQPTEIPQPTETAISLTPQQGAQLAASYLGRSDLYSVEGGYLYGVYVYKVIFSNGDAAYVSLDGQILRVEPAVSAAVQPSAGSGSTYGDDDD